jgi:hypothetical protein
MHVVIFIDVTLSLAMIVTLESHYILGDRDNKI